MRPLALPQLDDIQVAAPCPADWDIMTPVDGAGDRVRHCDRCALNVYNLSAMSRAEAESLLRAHEGRLCARFFRRPDGTIITRDCPRGVAAARAAARRASARLAALACALAGLIGAGAALAATRDRVWYYARVRDSEPHTQITRALAPGVRPSPARCIMGEISLP